MIGFNKKSDGRLAGHEVEGGTSWEGERNSGNKEKFLTGDMGETDVTLGLEVIANHVAGWG